MYIHLIETTTIKALGFIRRFSLLNFNLVKVRVRFCDQIRKKIHFSDWFNLVFLNNKYRHLKIRLFPDLFHKNIFDQSVLRDATEKTTREPVYISMYVWGLIMPYGYLWIYILPYRLSWPYRALGKR